MNALVAADALIVPLCPPFLAAEGLVNLLGSLDTVRNRLGTTGELLGILFTLVDAGGSTSRTVPTGLRHATRSRATARLANTAELA